MGSIMVYDKIKMQKMYAWKDCSKVWTHFFVCLFRLINVYLLNVNKCFCTDGVQICFHL